MRRALPAAGLTAAALLMLSRFHTAPAATGVKPRVETTSTQTTSTTVPADAGPGAFAPPPTTDGPSSTTSPGGPTDGTYTGTAIETRWGPVQVQIVVKGNRLSDVQAVEVPNSHDRSIEINDQALPILRDEALTAQSANLDLVSGATITWDAYRQSLQAALDLAHG